MTGLRAGTNCWWEPNQRHMELIYKVTSMTQACRVTQQWRQKGGRGAKEQEKEVIKCQGGGAAGVQLDEEVATGTEGEKSNIWLGWDIYWGR